VLKKDCGDELHGGNHLAEWNRRYGLSLSFVLGYNEDVEVRHALRLEYNLTELETHEFSKRNATHWPRCSYSRA
jgi:hypothetical protein